MKRVLLITYAWPPAGGPGVQRNIKFCKYLPQFGWESVVVTVRGGEYLATDDSLAAEIPASVRVIKTPVLEPHRLYKRLMGIGREDKIPQAAIAEENVGWKKRWAFWINANVFIPDPRIGWYPIAVRAVKDLLRKEKFDVVMSSGPPHTTHLIARRISRWKGIPWVADFRDPWTAAYYLVRSPRIPCVQRFDARLERSVLQDAHRIITVTRGMIEDDFIQKVPSNSKYIQITNGYDEADFQSFYTDEKPDPSVCRLVHTGMVSETQLPENLFHVIKRLAERQQISPARLSVRFVGNVSDGLRRCIEESNVKDFVEISPYVPHAKVFNSMGSSTMLLLLLPNREKSGHVLTGKLFEYLRSGKPILAFGPRKSEVEEILSETRRGWIFDYSDTEGLERFLDGFLNKKRPREYSTSTAIADVSRFSRETLTERLAGVFNDLLSQQGGPDG